MPTKADKTIVIIDHILWFLTLLFLVVAFLSPTFYVAAVITLAGKLGTSIYLLKRMFALRR